MGTLLYFLLVFTTVTLPATVILRLQGQLGNQLFQIATAVALAQENQCDLYFPDFSDVTAPYLKTRDVEKNYHALFHRIPRQTSPVEPAFFYSEPGYEYHPIPYRENMEISGFFQSEKYFKKYRNLVVQLFAAPREVEEDLHKQFASILQHPNTVEIGRAHV